MNGLVNGSSSTIPIEIATPVACSTTNTEPTTRMVIMRPTSNDNLNCRYSNWHTVRNRMLILLLGLVICGMNPIYGFSHSVLVVRKRDYLSPRTPWSIRRSTIRRGWTIRESCGLRRPWRMPTVASVGVSRLEAFGRSTKDANTNGSTITDRDANTLRNNNAISNRNTNSNTKTSNDGTHSPMSPPNVDAMVARAAKLRQSIREQQMELQRLETQLICCTDDPRSIGLFSYNTGKDNDATDQSGVLQATINRTLRMFLSSTQVLLRKLDRVRTQSGPNNQRYDGSMSNYLQTEMATIPRILQGLVQNPHRIRHLVDPSTPTLLPHVPAILSRLDELESHLPPILERVLNNSQHLASIEPYLPEILERFDDIEPHLPWILDNIDALAPNTGLLLNHIDDLLLYADCDDIAVDSNFNSNSNFSSSSSANTNSSTNTNTDTNTNTNNNAQEENDWYALAAQLLPYLEYYVSRLDVIGPHLPLLRPHIPLLLQYNRIGKISPHIDKLFARGYKDLSASANMDVLLFWFGWTLRIPGLPRLFFALPGSPKLVSVLANRLPKRFVRGSCSNVQCCVDVDYGEEWNRL